jgi:hypothetical protein
LNAVIDGLEAFVFVLHSIVVYNINRLVMPASIIGKSMGKSMLVYLEDSLN